MMVIKVDYPLTIKAGTNTLLLAETGHPEALKLLNDQLATLETESALALAQVNDLLNDGYTLLFRERVQTAQGENLILFFHKSPTPLETAEQIAIKDAIRLYNNPPVMDGVGEHPDTLRLRAVMDCLLKVGIYPEALDDTQKIAVLNIEEVDW